MLVLMKEEYLGLKKVEKKSLHVMLEEMKDLMEAATRDLKWVSMKLMNLDLLKAQEMVPVLEEMTVSIKVLRLEWFH